MVRVGLVGFGFIGAGLYRAIRVGDHKGLEVAFVWNRSRDKLASVQPDLVLDDLGEAAARKPDLIVEASHPDISRMHGEAFLAQADYMPLSVTALADDALRERLTRAATHHGHHLILPQGAL